MKKQMDSIGKKIVAMVLLIGVTLSAAALIVGWRSYTANTNTLLKSIGENAVNTLASQITPAEVDRYYETMTPDDRYYQVQKLARDIVEAGLVKCLYVVHVEEQGYTYVFDSDGGETSGEELSLGIYEDASHLSREDMARFLSGEAIEPFINYNEEYGGWSTVISVPFCYDNGMLAGYICADVDMNEIVHNRRAFLVNTSILLTVLTGILMGVSFSIAGRRITGPIRSLTAAVEAYEEHNDQRILKDLEVESDDEIGALTAAFKKMVTELQMSSLFEEQVVVREQRLESELSITREIGRALLPKSLPRRREGYPFEVRGALYPEESMEGTFYDYFLDERNRLCVLIGDVPGEGISQVLYTAMARAILKSQLRTDLTLTEAVGEANRQIHELSDTFSLNVLAGVLDSATGRFAWVNAGGEAPFLLRSQELCRRMRVMTFAPVGQNAHVVYQEQELTLRQGDRLLFLTHRMAELADGEGRTYPEAGLSAVLNEKENRLGSLEHMLSEVSAGGSAFAGPAGSGGVYALLGLEYSRRDRAKAHLLVSANAAGGSAMRKFLREQMEANGLSLRQIAEVVVLGDELFSLCCRQVGEDARFMAECEVPEGQGVVCLRLKGAFHGRDPLRMPMGEASRNGAAFIRKNCEQALFERGSGADRISIVRRVGQGEG